VDDQATRVIEVAPPHEEEKKEEEAGLVRDEFKGEHGQASGVSLFPSV
jgi:hypothetical protein